MKHPQSKQQAGRNPAQRDLPFIWWEAVRAHTARRRQELVDNADLGNKPHLKRMLCLLHYRCSASGVLKRICWPSLNDLCTSLKYDWPGAKRTISRQIADLKSMGLLWVQDRSRNDGSQTSNVYAIRYGALRKYAKPASEETCPRGVGITSTPIDAGVYGGRRPRLRGVGIMSTLELDPKETKETKIAASGEGSWMDGGGEDLKITENTGIASGTQDQQQQSRTSIIDGKLTYSAGPSRQRPDPLRVEYADYSVQDKFQVPPSRKSGRPSGWWAGAVTRSILSDRANVVALYRAAVKAEVIQDTPVNRVRVITLVIQALAMGDDQFKGTFGGYVISHIERGTWNYLDPRHVQTALQRIKGELQLTPDEFKQVRQPELKGAL